MEPPPDPGDDDVVAVTALDANEVDDPCPADARLDTTTAESAAMSDEASRLEPSEADRNVIQATSCSIAISMNSF